VPRRIQRLADARILASSRRRFLAPERPPATVTASATTPSGPGACSAPRAASPRAARGADPERRTRASAGSATHLTPAVAGILFLVPLLLVLPARLSEVPPAPAQSVAVSLERPFDVSLAIDGRAVASTQSTLWVAPGEHHVVAWLPDGRRLERRFAASLAPLTVRIAGDPPGVEVSESPASTAR
jgi:hypothetical protein